MDTRRGHSQLLEELNEERAAALQRISAVMTQLIEQLHASRERIEQAPAAQREFEIAAFRRLRTTALKQRWYLEVQREALGLRHHAVLDEFYQIPTMGGRR
jgi:hypothetical protein